MNKFDKKIDTNDNDLWILPENCIIKQGAEAKIYVLQHPETNENVIVKERFKKNYRHPLLDAKLTLSRLKNEVRYMLRARSLGIDTPYIQLCDLSMNRIFMEYVHGITTRDQLFQWQKQNDIQSSLNLAHRIGVLVRTIHNGHLIHGDLTTSNILIRGKNGNLVLIDFGLSYASTTEEDKAVDLYVLERALLSTHTNSEQMFEIILKAYAVDNEDLLVVNRLDQVRTRGRKKDMIG